MSAFRFSAEKYHLTYKDWIHPELLIEKFRSIGELKCYSIVHENGDEHEDVATPYAHTHAAVFFKKALDSTNKKLFDIEDIHPNIANKRSIKWFAHLLDHYHKGYKTKQDGKKYFIEPVKLVQYGTERVLGESVLFEAIEKADSLTDACMIAGVLPKSIGDVNIIRKEAGMKRKRVCVPDRVDPDRFVELAYDKDVPLVLKGPPNIGKTSWAISRFENPLKVSDIDDLRSITNETDGLVFDEMLFGHYPKATQVYLLDMDYSNTIRARHTNATIPKGMPRIFLCNEDESTFGCFPHEAVKRRYTEIIVDYKLWE